MLRTIRRIEQLQEVNTFAQSSKIVKRFSMTSTINYKS